MSYVLLVDDNDDNLEMLRALVGSNGLLHASASHGVEALQRAHEAVPAAVVADLLMPVMDGYTLLRRWKSDPDLSQIPFIVYTATYTDPEDEQLAMDLGADAFIAKSADPNELLARLRTLVSGPSSGRRMTPRLQALPPGPRVSVYNERLVRKLEAKTLQLHATNRALLEEIAKRREIASRQVQTEIKLEASEIKLEESEAQYLLLLNSTAEGIYRLDVNGVCTFCNPTAARLLGYQHPGEVVGRAAHEHHHGLRPDGSPYPCAECPIHRAPHTGRGTSADDAVFWRADGTSFPVEYWSYPIVSGPDIAGTVVTFLDITRRRDLEAQFMQSQKMEAVGRLAGGVAHDFNNALQVILVNAELLEERLPDDPEGLELNQEILAAGRRAASLTQQLLALSRKQVLCPSLLDLNAVTGNIETMLRRTIGEDIALSIDCEPGLGVVKADRGQIEQALINLVINSRDAMPTGGKLFITTSSLECGDGESAPHAFIKPGSYAVISIRDTGIGMDQATLGRIFEPFFTTKEPGKGTGLGLSTVYGIMKQSHGYVVVDSEPKRGAEFRLYFPVVGGIPESIEPREPAAQARQGQETVLLVEDEPALRSVVGNMLRSHGYAVLDADAGKAAIDLANNFAAPIDLLLADVILPGISGPAVAARLRASRPLMKVMYMSGYTDDFIAHHGILDRPTVLLEKPFTITSLLRRIRETLDGDPAPAPLERAAG